MGVQIEGNKMVVTGKLEGMTRKQVEDYIKAEGGSVSGSVTSSTDVLIVGEKPGSKLSKALQYGTEIVPATVFISQVNPDYLLRIAEEMKAKKQSKNNEE